MGAVLMRFVDGSPVATAMEARRLVPGDVVYAWPWDRWTVQGGDELELLVNDGEPVGEVVERVEPDDQGDVGYVLVTAGDRFCHRLPGRAHVLIRFDDPATQWAHVPMPGGLAFEPS